MKSEALVFFVRGETAITKVKYGREKMKCQSKEQVMCVLTELVPLCFIFNLSEVGEVLARTLKWPGIKNLGIKTQKAQ